MAKQEKIPSEDSLILVLLQIREAIVTGRLKIIWWVHTGDMLADALTKGGVTRNILIAALELGRWKLQQEAESSAKRIGQEK